MNRRNAFFALAALIAAGVVLAILLTRGGDGDDDDQAAPEPAPAETVEASPLAAVTPVGASPPVASSSEDVRDAIEDLEQFWTPERISQALQNPAREPAGGLDRDTGPVGSTPGSAAPGGKAAGSADPELSEIRAAAGKCRQPRLLPATSGYPYTRTCVKALQKLPARTVGQLVYEIPGDDLYFCSATVAHTPTGSVLLTAGHCVVSPPEEEGGQFVWHKNMGFIPSYKVADFWNAFSRDAAALGQFAADHIWWALPLPNLPDYQYLFAPVPWRDTGSFEYDVAAIVVARRNGQTVEDFIGAGQGWDFTGQLRPSRARLFGYPLGPPFDGRRLFRCDGKVSTGYRGQPGEQLFGTGCDMTGGSSGGPWFTGLSGGVGVVFSVNSFGPPNIMYGPILSGSQWETMRGAMGVAVP